ncbi:MAG: dephospho-CoA kinase [Sphingobacteriales bacterium]|nr:MAG: dephospho-CoA kinase [Sphingobacteriales bacterium]
MLKIGITGGMGSGKTTVCKVFETLGVSVYYADDRAKLLMNESPYIINQLKAFFGEDIYGENQELDRPKLAKMVFNDKSLLEKLESVVHPAVANDFETWAKQKHFSGKAYMVKEAALLFESGSYKTLYEIILVKSPLEERILRIIKRDKCTREDALKRIEKQWTDEQKEPLSQHIIYNTETQLLLPQIIQLHKLFSGISTN